MVCPWMENGSVSKHLERCGDIMSTTDRLKLVRCLIYILPSVSLSDHPTILKALGGSGWVIVL